MYNNHDNNDNNSFNNTLYFSILNKIKKKQFLSRLYSINKLELKIVNEYYHKNLNWQQAEQLALGVIANRKLW